jgi:hypothetical protein
MDTALDSDCEEDGVEGNPYPPDGKYTNTTASGTQSLSRAASRQSHRLLQILE